MVDFLLVFFLLVYLSQLIISMALVSRMFLLYRDISSLQLVVVVILGNITILFTLLYYYADLLPVGLGTLSFKVALGSIIALIITITLVLDKTIYSYRTRALSKLSLFIFSVLFGIIVYEFLTMTDKFFFLINVKGYLVPYYGLEPSLLLFIGGPILLSCFYSSYNDIVKISEGLVSRKGFYFILVSSLIIFSAYITNLIIQTFSAESLIESPFINKDTIYFMHFCSLNLLCFSLAYFSYTQPFLNLTTGVRPNLLLENGQLGYFLATHSDNGPEPLSMSGEFVSNANLSFNSLNSLAVSSIVLVGAFSEEDNKFISKVSLIPIPNSENFSALVYTFVIKSNKITDPRFKDNSPSVFAILFPSNLTIAIRSMNQTLKIVLEYIQKFDDIDQLNQQQHLHSLATIVLRKILL